MSQAYPSAGGIAMFLQKAYGKGLITAVCALLMYFSMVINESLVARTFGVYVLQLFDAGQSAGWLVPALGAGLLVLVFAVNISGNQLIQALSSAMALVKIGGILVFAGAGLWIADFSTEPLKVNVPGIGVESFFAATALGVLAYKGFTTITNSGSEIVDPHRNVARAIIIALILCVVVYFLVALAVGMNLSLTEIVQARDFALAEAARPALGGYGLWFTVALAIVATVSGLIASVFAVSRMLTMLTDMELVPHRHFGMPGTLVYTIVLALVFTVFFDLSRIASLGIIFYLVMDIAVHWGVMRHTRSDVSANSFILVTAIVLDAVVLVAFVLVKLQRDPLVVAVALVSMLLILDSEALFLRLRRSGS